MDKGYTGGNQIEKTTSRGKHTPVKRAAGRKPKRSKRK